MFSLVPKAALVWPPGGEGSHNKGAGVAGGVGGSSPPTSQQAAPQGLVHWMSVMAEHMNNPHHDAVHYMWNGVEVSTYYFCFSLIPLSGKRKKIACTILVQEYNAAPLYASAVVASMTNGR